MEDWRDGKSFTECNLYLFDNSIGCDITFEVGVEQEKIEAHKYVLACRSAVFQAMFWGAVGANDSVIKIPDCDAKTFRVMMRYLYGNVTDISASNALALLYVANKYLITELIHMITTFLQDSLNEDNCVIIFQQANIFGEKGLESKALEKITVHAQKILKSKDFETLEMCYVKIILARDDLDAKEEDIFDAVMQWAKCKCSESKLEETAENLRALLVEIVDLVRFPLMDKIYFTEHVYNTGLLTNDENIVIMRNMLNPNCIEDLKFKTKQRCPPVKLCRRFTNSSSKMKWNQNGSTDAISFKTNKTVDVVGFELFGPSDVDSMYTISYSFSNASGITLCVGSFTRILTRDVITDVKFDNPVSVASNEIHSLEIIVKGPKCSVCDNGMQQVNIGDVSFEFYSSLQSRNGTNTSQGQIQGILYIER